MSAMKPVWVTYPRIPWGSIGWRMGAGETYWHSWVQWFKALPSTDRRSYVEAWPEPDGWEGFFDMIETGQAPAWLSGQQRLTADSAIPPAPDEDLITERHRVVWLMHQYFKHLSSDARRDDESAAEIFSDPQGGKWRLSVAKSDGRSHFRRHK
jgi:hypothetical protein